MEFPCPLPPLSQEEVLHTLNGIEQMPTLPDIVQRIVQSLSDPESRLQDLSRMILSDQSISVQVLRVANSAYYGLPSRVTTLERAIMVLGFDEVRRITLAAMILRALPGGDREVLTEIWRHSLATAWFSRYIAEKVKEQAVNESYAAGLLHDIGKVVIVRYFPKHFHYINHYVKTLNRPSSLVEQAILGMDHSQVGDWLANLWNLPAILKEAIASHHALERDSKVAAQRVARIVALANRIADKAGFGSGLPKPRSIPDPLFYGLDLASHDGEDLLTRKEEIRGVVQSFF